MQCKKCGSENLTVIKSGPHNKLVCTDCKAYQKFVSKEESFDFKNIVVPKDILVRIDSLLSCLKHRHGRYLEKVDELGSVIREYTS